MLNEYDIEGTTFYLLYGKILQPQLIKPVNLTCSQVKPVIRQSGALMARWIREYSDQPTNLWYSVQDSFHAIEEYKSRVRTYIRSGLRNYRFVYINNIDVIAKAVYIVDSKLGYAAVAKIEKIKDHVRSLTSAYQWWILYDQEDNISGYVLVYVAKEQVQVRTIHILPEAKKKGAAYFVNFKLSEIFLKEQKKKSIIYGMRNLEHKTNVQQWLEEKMFYTRKYVRMEVCLSPLAKFVYMLGSLFYPLVYLLPFRQTKRFCAFVKFISLARKDKKE